ncbi:MAG: uncharacterized protein KVP18_002476 [Porospora cf. gigantea A]|nr:MAG: hypothetical protein KVP18_002476 [Porospora cf. gigantea A]
MSEQHDVHDLYLVILDALLECSPNKSWVDVVLGVELTAETKCVECGHASRVPAKSPYFRVDIADSFDTTVKPKIEYMTAQGARYRCSFCRVQQPARRLETITDIPRMLVVQLMRLRFDGAKNFDTVSIPEDFLLEPYLRFPWILRSVILHAGDRSQGHYVALVKVGNQWWLTNDEELNKVSVAELDLYLGESQTNTELSQMLCPYLLFYEREDQVS